MHGVTVIKKLTQPQIPSDDGAALIFMSLLSLISFIRALTPDTVPLRSSTLGQTLVLGDHSSALTHF